MGPKGKPKTPQKPKEDPREVVTELQKEFFEFQLADIEKKLSRIGEREEELTAGTAELEEKIEELKKEKGAIIEELEQLLAMKEEEKCQKREETLFLEEEVKLLVERYKEQIKAQEQKFNDMVEELTAQIEALEEEVRILEDFKQNKELYIDMLDKFQQEMDELEKQHQRNLFAINKKCEEAKGRVKKELQSRLLQLSIEFRARSQKKIGNPCHRATQENKAIRTALMQMKDEILEYDERSVVSRLNMYAFKNLRVTKEEENAKVIARMIVQVKMKETLVEESMKLAVKLKEFSEVDNLNRILQRRLRSVTNEIDRKVRAMEEVQQEIQEQTENTNVMREAAKHLSRSSRRLLLLIRNAIKIAEDAKAVRLIPMGMIEAEKLLSIERKIKLYRNRRDQLFAKKGRILVYLLEFLSKAQLTEHDRKLLRTSADSLEVGMINFSQIYGKAIVEEEEKEMVQEVEEEKKKGPVFFTSLTSLPRSYSTLILLDEKESEGEFEGEYGEYGGYAVPMEPDDNEADFEKKEGKDVLGVKTVEPVDEIESEGSASSEHIKSTKTEQSIGQSKSTKLEDQEEKAEEQEGQEDEED